MGDVSLYLEGLIGARFHWESKKVSRWCNEIRGLLEYWAV